MRLHPLHTVERIRNHMQSTGGYWPPERCTARTEQLALRFVAQAMHTPHTWHKVTDHHDTVPAKRELLQRCQNIVHRMGYEHFQFRPTEICFGSPVWQE